MSRKSMGGFALPLVLVAIAAALLSVAALTQSADGRLASVRREATLLAADILAESAHARIAHLMVTEPFGVRSLDVAQVAGTTPGVRRRERTVPVILDGRPYSLRFAEGANASVTVNLQDEAGLINLNSADEGAVARLLVLQGIPEDAAGQLAAALADYVDEDALRRSGAAASGEGGGEGPGLRNRLLADPRQVLGVRGWERAFPGRGFETVLLQTTTRAPTAPFNPNTATSVALQSIFAIEASAAGRAIELREKQILPAASDLLALLGADEVRTPLRAAPADSMLLTITAELSASKESFVYVSRLSVAKESADRPISVTRLSRPMRSYPRELGRSGDGDRLVSLPVSASLFAP
jgi:type II secretory pathway component PulK